MSAFAKLKQQSQQSFANLKTKIESEGSYKKDSRFWEIEMDKTGNAYAVIRFLPETSDKDSPFVAVYNHGFKNPKSGKWFIEKCATTIKGQCPVCDANSKLWNTGLKEKQVIASSRKRVVRYIANILVVSDPKHPENEGKVFLFAFNETIHKLIKSCLKPEFPDDPEFNPFDMWTGANLKLKIRKVDGNNNYDFCKFESQSAISDDDSLLEKIFNSEYKLDEFLDPSSFKSYDEVKTRFETFVANLESDTKTEQPMAPRVQQTPVFNQSSNTSDDEDLEMLRNLMDA